MAWEDPVVIASSSARTVTGNSGALPCPKALNLSILIEVTAQSGTAPTLDLSVEWSMDGTNFGAAQTADAFTQITTTTPTRAVKSFSVKAPYYRLVWTIGGTSPSYTFSATRYGVGQ